MFNSRTIYDIENNFIKRLICSMKIMKKTLIVTEIHLHCLTNF